MFAEPFDHGLPLRIEHGRGLVGRHVNGVGRERGSQRQAQKHRQQTRAMTRAIEKTVQLLPNPWL